MFELMFFINFVSCKNRYSIENINKSVPIMMIRFDFKLLMLMIVAIHVPFKYFLVFDDTSSQEIKDIKLKRYYHP